MFEGTPDEVIQAMIAMQAPTSPSSDVIAVAPTGGAEDGEKTFVSTAVARKVFTRRPLSAEQKKVLNRLANDHPQWTLITQLQGEVGYTPAQFAGLMGAFGRRLSHTDGYVYGSWLFDAEWNEKNGCWAYRLPDSVLEALKLEKLV